MNSTDVLEAPLQGVEFLARSPNRFAVLEELTDGPVDRYELEDAFDGVTGDEGASLASSPAGARKHD